MILKRKVYKLGLLLRYYQTCIINRENTWTTCFRYNFQQRETKISIKDLFAYFVLFSITYLSKNMQQLKLFNLASHLAGYRVQDIVIHLKLIFNSFVTLCHSISLQNNEY